MSESTEKYVIPMVGGPCCGATMYYNIEPPTVFKMPRPAKDIAQSQPGDFDLNQRPRHGFHKYLLQRSPLRYIYEHLV